MTKKDLDIAIEKCERIMEFDTRTLKNPESENGHIFEKIYDLLQFLRQFQFATDTNVATTDTISRRAAIDALAEAMPSLTTPDGCGQFDHDIQVTDEAYVDCMRIIHDLPSAQRWIPTSVKPPEPFKLVLIQDSCGCYELNTYIPPRINPKRYPNGYWGEVGTVYFDYFDVEAWCPLPAPYRPEGENSERHDQ